MTALVLICTLLCFFIMTATSSNSCNTFVTNLSVTPFPSSSFLFLKISHISKSLIRGVLTFISIWSFFLIMPFIKSFAFSQCNKLMTIILLLGEIMPFCFCCLEKLLVCVAIAALTRRQSSFCVKCTQANMQLSCNICSVFDIECVSCVFYCCLRLPHLSSGNIW